VPKQMVVVDCRNVNPRNATGVFASPCLRVPRRFSTKKLLMKCPIPIQPCVLAAACALRPVPRRQSKLCKATARMCGNARSFSPE
jgi:hypothetical protein